MVLTADGAFRAYEAVRHRLPPARPPRRSFRRAGNLADISDDFDVFLLDAFGVLNIGETAIPGTRERIDDLRRAGKRVVVVSNAASVPTAALAEKYRRLGYSFAVKDIVTSRAAMAAFLTDGPTRAWGVVAGDDTDFDDLGQVSTHLLGDAPDPYREAEGFLLIGTATWSAPRQQLLEAALENTARPVLVANPDIVAPREDGFSTEPGYYAHQLADRTGVAPHFFGKPFTNVYDLAFAQLGAVDRSRVLMVGDSLHTDILGAKTAGIASALVSGFGFFAGQDAEAAIRRSGIVPDFIIERP